MVSAIPIWLYWRIHAVDPASTAIILALVTIASTWLVAFSYRNTKHVIKHKVAVKREAAVTRDMNREVKNFRANLNSGTFVSLLAGLGQTSSVHVKYSAQTTYNLV